MNNRTIGIFVFMFTLFSCNDSSVPIDIDEKAYKIQLPGYLKKDELAEDAILEYANRYRNFYMALFEMPLNIAEDSLWRNSTKRITNALVNSRIDTSRDNDGHLLSEIIGTFKDEPEKIYYHQKLILHPKGNYLLTLWIRGEQRHMKYKEDIAAISNSLKIKD